jgi:hypothetical protein
MAANFRPSRPPRAHLPLSELLAANSAALRVALMAGGPTRRQLRSLIEDLAEQAEMAHWLERRAQHSQQGRAAA